MDGAGNPVLFFDGVCMLCNRMLQLVLKHDRKRIFRFATLQGKRGMAAREMVKAAAADSIVLLYKGKYYVKSGAVLRAAWLLGGRWSLMAIGFIIPRFIRDWVYDSIARHRYQWFGKNDSCMIPDAGISDRFLPE